MSIFTILFPIILVLLILCAFLFIKIRKAKKREALRMLNPVVYNEIQRQEQLRKETILAAEKRAKEERLAKLPECPICKSKEYVERITTMDRGVSVAMVGLASGKIGKQYRCKKCKHMW